jgi:ABC-type nickel/cobalt efflux system permease component RcnA
MMNAFPSPAPRHALVADIGLGGAVGTLFGLLVGLSGSTAVVAIAAVATVLAGSVVVLQGSERAIRPARAGALAFAAIASLVAGTWLQRHDALGPSPADEVAAWRAAGFSKRSALMMTAASRGGDVTALQLADLADDADKKKRKKRKKKRRTHEQYCADLESRGYTPAEELRSWKRRGGAWAQAATFVERAPCNARAKMVTEMRALACGRH